MSSSTTTRLDPRKSGTFPLERTQSGRRRVAETPFDESIMGSPNMMMYLVVGVAAVSMGVSIFLYREVKKVKTDMTELSKDVKEIKENPELAENTKTIEELNDKVTQIGQMIQHLAMSRSPQRQATAPSDRTKNPHGIHVSDVGTILKPPQPVQSVAPVKESVPVELPKTENTVIHKDDILKLECDDDKGICKIPEVKKEGKILQI